ncbi:MAG: hypothetical protein ACLQVJ_12670 [Syntrophobacteraceae bacterium]
MQQAENLSGYLLTSFSRGISQKDLLALESIQFVRQIEESSWEEYCLESKEPLIKHEEEKTSIYRYPLICRRSGTKILMLSHHRRVVDFVLSDKTPKLFSPNLQRVFIEVDKLVRTITRLPDKYVLSSVYARVPAFGNALRTISFYGDDVAEASIFRDHLKLMNCFNCGLRDVTGGPEIVRLGSEGSVSFIYSGPPRVKEVEAVLSYISKLRFFSDRISQFPF